MAYKIITKATVEPVTLVEARKHLRIEPFGSPSEHPDDDQVEMLITSAREWCEQYTGMALAAQTIDVAYDDFPENEIVLPLSPTISITSVKYADTDNVEQTVSSSVYGLDDFSKPNFVVLTPDSVWPETNGGANNVKIRTVVGNAPADVPFAVKSAILLIVGNLYENRQEDQLATGRASFNSLPMGVFNLLQPYRINMGV